MMWWTTDAVAGHGLGRLDPAVLLEIGRDAEVDVGHRPLGRDVIGLGHLEDDVGLADRPAFGKRPWAAAGPWVAQRRALIDPGQQRRPLLGREAAVVAEMAVPRVRVPGRHAPLVDHLADHRRMLARIVVSQQRERPDLAGPVAALALVLDDPRDVGRRT